MVASDMQRPVFTVFDPTADEDADQETIAPRFPTLDGKVVAFLDNTKDQVETIFDELQLLLRSDFPAAEFKYFRKHSVSGATPEMLDDLAKCDVVISAVGD